MIRTPMTMKREKISANDGLTPLEIVARWGPSMTAPKPIEEPLPLTPLELAIRERRKIRLKFTGELLLDVLAGRVRVTNVPRDAALYGVWYEWESNCWQVKIAHPDFAPTLEGSLIPEVLAVIEEVKA